MFNEKELAKGAKRAVLEYIAANGIPISRILTDDKINKLRNYHVKGLKLIVRGDNACQIEGFSGIFPSYSTEFPNIGDRSREDIEVLATQLTLEQLISVVKLNGDGSIKPDEDELGLLRAIEGERKEIKHYCKALGIKKVPDRILPLVQDLHGHSDNLFQHPHDPNKVVISQQRVPGSSEEYTVIYNRKSDQFLYILNTELWHAVDQKFEPSPENEGYMRKAIETYDKIVALDKFAKGKAKDLTYEMEFGRHRDTGELLVYQFRKFRRKETAGFRLDDIDIGEDSLRFNLAFGITPKDGIELIYRPSIPADEGENLSNNITRIIPMGRCVETSWL